MSASRWFLGKLRTPVVSIKIVFEHTGHCKQVEYVLLGWWRVGVVERYDVEISGSAGGKSKLDGRLEDDIDDEDDDEDDEDEEGEWRFKRTPESLSLVNESLSRSDAKDVDEISSVEWCSVVVCVEVNAHV